MLGVHTLLDLPPPVSQSTYVLYMKVVATGAAAEVEDSMKSAHLEIRDASPKETIDNLISCDSTWQKRGFSSLFGAVFIIAYVTGKKYLTVLLKCCSVCKLWEDQDEITPKYIRTTSGNNSISVRSISLAELEQWNPMVHLHSFSVLWITRYSTSIWSLMAIEKHTLF